MNAIAEAKVSWKKLSKDEADLLREIELQTKSFVKLYYDAIKKHDADPLVIKASMEHFSHAITKLACACGLAFIGDLDDNAYSRLLNDNSS